MCIVFSLELLFKRENKVCQKAKCVMKGCKYSSHSYLNLSLISEVPRKGIFSLLNEYRRETDKDEQKGRRSISALRARCQDARVYSAFLDDNPRENEVFVGLWVVGCGPRTLRFYDFSLQILFQEIEIGHL